MIKANSELVQTPEVAVPEIDSMVTLPTRDSYSGLQDTHEHDVDPWNGLMDDTAPEEDDIPDPGREVISFMEMSVRDAQQVYQKMLESRADPNFAKAAPVINLLRSDWAMAVFVPSSWDGIKHIPPLRLEFRPDMPKRIKPAARRIPPKKFTKLRRRVCTYDEVLLSCFKFGYNVSYCYCSESD